MLNVAITIGEILGAIIGAITVANFIFCRRSEVDEKIASINNSISNSNLSNQKDLSLIKDEIYNKMTENKDSLESSMKEFITILSDIKESDKELSVNFITLINAVKDELKNDYTSRYNDLLLIINTKANEADFSRMEQKFDKINETMTQLKTIIELQLEEKKREKN